jgi:hypothetical protein
MAASCAGEAGRHYLDATHAGETLRPRGGAGRDKTANTYVIAIPRDVKPRASVTTGFTKGGGRRVPVGGRDDSPTSHGAGKSVVPG